MNWYVYKKDDPNTWPELDCPFLLYANNSMFFTTIAQWDNSRKCFVDDIFREDIDTDECFYVYITCVPKGYKTHAVAKCVNDNNCPYGCDDDGYCMYDELTGSDTCGSKRIVNEYEIEMELACKEFK